MRTLKLHFPDDALPTLDTFLKQTKAARVFRRAQGVRNVVKGQRLQTVSDALQFTYSALRKWVHRFANQGTAGLVDRPRPGRPPKLTCELEKHLNRLVEQDPLEHGSVYSQWSCRELATVFASQTGVQLGRESVRCALKKTTIRSKAKLLLHGMKSLCYGDPAAFNSEAFGNQEDHHGLPLACGDNIQTDCVGS
jgi:transposase